MTQRICHEWFISALKDAEDFIENRIKVEETDSTLMTNEELVIGMGLIAFSSLLQQCFINSKYINVEIQEWVMKFVMRCYLLKDKRLLISSASLIFRPWNLILYISEYVEGNFNEEIEWPISSKIFKSKIKFEESEIMIKEREFFLNLK